MGVLMYKKEVKTKVYEEHISTVAGLSERLGVSFTYALNVIISDWELNRKTKESYKDGRESSS